MPAPPLPAALQTAFDAVLVAFNATPPDYDTLVKTVEPDVIIKRVLFPGSIIGMGNVESYLKHHMLPLQPRLHNLAIDWWWEVPAQTHGQVRARGDYVDSTIPPPPSAAVPIHFNLVFIRKSTVEPYTLHSAFATRTS